MPCGYQTATVRDKVYSDSKALMGNQAKVQGTPERRHIYKEEAPGCSSTPLAWYYPPTSRQIVPWERVGDSASDLVSPCSGLSYQACTVPISHSRNPPRGSAIRPYSMPYSAVRSGLRQDVQRKYSIPKLTRLTVALSVPKHKPPPAIMSSYRPISIRTQRTRTQRSKVILLLRYPLSLTCVMFYLVSTFCGIQLNRLGRFVCDPFGSSYLS
jgi:hypothetical protein